MQPARRNDYAVRVEMLPLIDVVFLLLTFFIYSMVVMVRAEVLPVTLNPLATGAPATPDQVQAITVDHAGNLFLNRQPVGRDNLDVRLAELAANGRWSEDVVRRHGTGRGPWIAGRYSWT